MLEYLPLLLLVGILYCIIELSRLQERLDQQDAKLEALLRHFDIPYGKYVAPSEQVLALARDPATRIEAIKAYRSETGLGLKQAVEVIDGLKQES